MTDIVKTPLTRDPQTKTEAQVRAKLLDLASEFADRAKSATEAGEAQIYAESAAVLFDAARARSTDVPPNGGRVAAPIDVPPDGG